MVRRLLRGVAPTELYAQRVGPAVAGRLRCLISAVSAIHLPSSSAAFAEATAPKGEADPPLKARNASQRIHSIRARNP
jgi:hypothetical protein